MLNAIGVNANLGPFNVVVSNAAFSFARQDVRTMSNTVIPAGLRIKANLVWLTIPFSFETVVSTDGFILDVSASQVTVRGTIAIAAS